MTLSAWVAGIGVRGPGLAGWHATCAILAGETPYGAAPTVLVAPPSLPPAERRRVGKGVKVALEVGHEAMAHANHDAASVASVFTSSSGDGDNCDAICRSLADDRLISPTRFHNSVHNAPSGYWGIASRSQAPSTSLCAFDASFAAGLVDALSQLGDDCPAVLLVAYDAPYPDPLFTARPTPDAFGVALLLTRDARPGALARLTLGDAAVVETTMDDAGLEACRRAIPAARALPLLAALATLATRTSATTVGIEDVHGRVLALQLHAAALQRLDHASIAARIPHAGRMVLLDTVEAWDDEHIVCSATSHRDPDNPLVVSGQLSSVCAIEYAAQAMAVHGSLTAQRDRTTRPRAGFLASVRSVTMDVKRLDDVADALTVVATRASGDEARVLYAFEVRAGDRRLVAGRAAVVLDAEGELFA